MKSLLRDNRATAIIELALIAPIVALTIAGIADLSNGFSRKLALEQGAQRAIEKILQTTVDSTVETTLANEAVCQVNGTNADGSCKSAPITSSDVVVSYRQDCTVASTGIVVTTTTTSSTVFDALTCGPALVQSKYIAVTVNDKYTPLFPIHFSALDADGTYHLSAVAGMRTS